MRKYFRIFFALAKASLIADLEFRVNFLTRIVLDVIWYLAQLTTFEVLFQHTDRIGSWDLQQTRVFLGMLFVGDAIYMILFHDNLDKMGEQVRKGNLDLLLAKPVNSQFMLSCQRLLTANLGNLIIALCWLVWAIRGLPEFDALRTFWLILLLPAGLLALYSFRFCFAATAVIFTKNENVQYLWYQLYKLGMRPDSIYFPWLKFIILTVLPVGFIASVPARALLEAPNYQLFLWVPLWSLTLLYLSHRFWNWALKHYTSASS